MRKQFKMLNFILSSTPELGEHFSRSPILGEQLSLYTGDITQIMSIDKPSARPINVPNEVTSLAMVIVSDRGEKVILTGWTNSPASSRGLRDGALIHFSSISVIEGNFIVSSGEVINKISENDERKAFSVASLATEIKLLTSFKMTVDVDDGIDVAYINNQVSPTDIIQDAVSHITHSIVPEASSIPKILLMLALESGTGIGNATYDSIKQLCVMCKPKYFNEPSVPHIGTESERLNKQTLPAHISTAVKRIMYTVISKAALIYLSVVIKWHRGRDIRAKGDSMVIIPIVRGIEGNADRKLEKYVIAEFKNLRKALIPGIDVLNISVDGGFATPYGALISVNDGRAIPFVTTNTMNEVSASTCEPGAKKKLVSNLAHLKEEHLDSTNMIGAFQGQGQGDLYV